MMILIFKDGNVKVATTEWTVESNTANDSIEIGYRGALEGEARYSRVELDLSMDSFIVALHNATTTGILNLSHISTVRG